MLAVMENDGVNAPAGWYPDPEQKNGLLRYWTGEKWTSFYGPVDHGYPVIGSPDFVSDTARDSSWELPEWVGVVVGWTLLLALLGYGAYVTFIRDYYTDPTPSSEHSRRVPYVQQDEPSAVCEDGTRSYSTHHQGTCSWHGGVDHWVK